jgi:hypothetical protein
MKLSKRREKNERRQWSFTTNAIIMWRERGKGKKESQSCRVGVMS